ncbi:hypothetical protein Pmar_PMAR020568 [Perkinsus marinus ATCC 50983]|uniref:Uncharacterized protein n=1 Tax=Perkinsus marinus (strain ATCC 50983 / TXsc) TaxID=423536 RepID=C5L7E1_PERM5|nr:hypothetical protein Pmar_PMAR020568 [Perkinsus marinus ATCC 50983]EER07403.1 hypothetical protein Pmar_PMAR020568 [Perkinsus marinus ATCC 50983]|eukprot:XP_002775587.1 hypothetical protein Pmar_PMAR020568 [Perkinsus marinus ATCC 50983]
MIICDVEAIEDGDTVELLRRDKYHAGSIYCMSWSPESMVLVTGSNDQSLQVMFFDHGLTLDNARERRWYPQAGTIRTVCAASLTTFLSGSSNEHCVRVWDVDRDSSKATLGGPRWTDAMPGNALSLSCGHQDDGVLVAVGSSGGGVSIWSNVLLVTHPQSCRNSLL